MQLYQTLHGNYPTNWQGVGETDIINFRLSKYGIEPLQALYVFVSDGFVLPGDRRILVMRIRPVTEGGTTGRYVVMEDSEHEIRGRWVKEIEIQRLLDQAKITLPTPDELELKAALRGVKALSDESAEQARSAQRNYLWISALGYFEDFRAGISRIFWKSPKIWTVVASSVVILSAIVAVRNFRRT